MAWFTKKSKRIESVPPEERVVKTENVFVKCDGCEQHLYKRELEEDLQVCRHCGYHFRIGARERLALLFDDGKYQELDAEVISVDPITASGKVGDHLVFAGAMDMLFIGGSMGSAVGEKVTRLIEHAIEEQGAAITFAASGGARMQEGTLSLMQMAKIASAMAQLEEKLLPFISVLTDPTTGGVTASFAMLGDLIIAEPKALIGFAGPRVIEQTIRQKLPKDFQRSEFLLEHGMLDAIVDRRELRDFIIKTLNFMMNPEIHSELKMQQAKRARS